MKREDGYILLKSLLTVAIVLICSAALFFSLTMIIKHNGHLKSNLEKEFVFRSEKIMEKLR